MIDYPIVMCCFIWAIVVLVLGILFFYYKNNKSKLRFEEAAKEREHVKELKKLSDELEASWYDKKNLVNNLKACTEEGLNNQVKDLKTKVSELEGKLKTEEFNKELLEKKLKMYSGIFEQLKVEIKPKA